MVFPLIFTYDFVHDFGKENRFYHDLKSIHKKSLYCRLYSYFR